MKLIYQIGGGSIALLLLGEIGLRLYGFAEAPLYKASDSYEYISQAQSRYNAFWQSYSL